MSKKLAINQDVIRTMGQDWNIKIDTKPFTPGKSARMPSLGYPCGACANTSTQLCFAESTDEANSRLLWMELSCRACQHYTLYTTKK